MRTLLQKPYPSQLQELRLIKVKMSIGQLSSLLDSLTECSFLRNLVLVRMGLNTHHVAKLIKYLETNYYIRVLDLSWNELTPL